MDKKYIFFKQRPPFFTSVLTIVIISLTWGLVYYYSSSWLQIKGSSNVILAEDGFSPEVLTIEVGQKVTFTTTRGKPFWPASNLHPTHELYSEFDPQRPIEPKDSWNFKFDEPGNWRYHDHLAPYYTGEILVVDKSIDNNITQSKLIQCHDLGEKFKVSCWDNLMKNILRERGIDDAFTLLNTLYETEPTFAGQCHNFAHAIGYEAYREFTKTKKFSFDVTPATTQCGYGFYHGFTTLLFGQGKDIEITRNFCEYIDTKLSKDSPGIATSCYHSIGHGAIAEPDKGLWGNADELIKQAVKICQDIRPDSQERLHQCYNGVFNGLVTLYITNRYGFSIDDQIKTDPYRLCREQTEELRNDCYMGLFILVSHVSDFDLIKASKFVEAISEDRYSKSSIRAIANNIVSKELRETDHRGFFEACRSLQERLRVSCLIGGLETLAGETRQGEEMQRVSICRTSLFTPDEREVCYKTIFRMFGQIYPAKKVHQICETISEQYRKFCI